MQQKLFDKLKAAVANINAALKIKDEAKISEAKELKLCDGKNLVSGEMQMRVKDLCTLTSVKFDSSPNHHYAKLVGGGEGDRCWICYLKPRFAFFFQ